MARTPEGKTKDAVTALLKELGIWYFFPSMNGYGRAGIPDIIGCGVGFFIAIECKADDGRTTALQERELSRIRDAGGFTYIAYPDNLKELKEMLQCLLAP